MIEKIGKVSNPLTIIAIFAGLAEVGGTIVLPFLQHETQAVYVWFLIAFPTFLVGVFFFVLYHKHEVLYAPSDYRDDSTFKDIVQRSISSQSLKKLETKWLEPKEFVTEVEVIETAPTQDHPAFTALSPQARKVLKTLWKFQQQQFPNNDSERWGFAVGSAAPDFIAFILGVVDVRNLGLIAIDVRGFCFLTDAGLLYCEQQDAAIAAETEFYGTFSN